MSARAAGAAVQMSRQTAPGVMRRAAGPEPGSSARRVLTEPDTTKVNAFVLSHFGIYFYFKFLFFFLCSVLLNECILIIKPTGFSFSCDT